MLKKIFISAFCTLCAFQLHAQTIAEKKASLQRGSSDLDVTSQQLLTKVNADIQTRRNQLHTLYKQVSILYTSKSDQEEYQELLAQIKEIRSEITSLEEEWQKAASSGSTLDSYALFNEPETNIEQLIIDYGAHDFVYLIPPDISAIKISVASNLPIPRTAWNDMIETILNQNGIGIRQLNPYLRELYPMKEQEALVRHITNVRGELEILPPDERIAFLLTPPSDDVRRVTFFLEKFINPQSMKLQQVGRDILLIANTAELFDLLKIYDFIAAQRTDQNYKLIPLLNVKAEEMTAILSTLFDQVVDTKQVGKLKRPPSDKKEDELPETNGLKIVALGKMTQGIFVVGSKKEIERAEKLIREVDSQFATAREKTLYTYHVKHSTAEELAQTLQRIYSAMIRERASAEDADKLAAAQTPPPPPPPPLTQNEIYTDSFYQTGDIVVNPAPITLGKKRTEKAHDPSTENFIVDPKTGSVIMVVEKDLLAQLQGIVRKLDVPKKMVQIEVLLFEKRINDRTDMGLNLLRWGSNRFGESCASNTNSSCLSWNDIEKGGLGNTGILEYVLSRAKSGSIPAFDLAYRFLISQENITINANPSTVTLNQTPAKISIVDEISINTGQFVFNTADGVQNRDSFTRAQYGINLEVTPTIHIGDEMNFGDETNYITLETAVNFDTIQQSSATSVNRPPVTRRKIRNEVLIPDGQTVILGGLRRKDVEDVSNKIPYLGEIPGFGKFFSTNALSDNTVEMFIFITPKIVEDPKEDLYKMRCQQMCRRPGDIPDYMIALNEARKMERDMLFAGTMKMLFGPSSDHYYPTKEGPCCEPCQQPDWDCICEKEYDGRS